MHTLQCIASSSFDKFQAESSKESLSNRGLDLDFGSPSLFCFLSHWPGQSRSSPPLHIRIHVRTINSFNVAVKACRNGSRVQFYIVYGLYRNPWHLMNSNPFDFISRVTHHTNHQPCIIKNHVQGCASWRYGFVRFLLLTKILYSHGRFFLAPKFHP